MHCIISALLRQFCAMFGCVVVMLRVPALFWLNCVVSGGIELVNAGALFLLLLLNLLLISRQQRLRKSEMVRRLKAIITQLSGENTHLIVWIIMVALCF